MCVIRFSWHITLASFHSFTPCPVCACVVTNTKPTPSLSAPKMKMRALRWVVWVKKIFFSQFSHHQLFLHHSVEIIITSCSENVLGMLKIYAHFYEYEEKIFFSEFSNREIFLLTLTFTNQSLPNVFSTCFCSSGTDWVLLFFTFGSKFYSFRTRYEEIFLSEDCL
jgi:hypothetical protein